MSWSGWNLKIKKNKTPFLSGLPHYGLVDAREALVKLDKMIKLNKVDRHNQYITIVINLTSSDTSSDSLELAS